MNRLLQKHEVKISRVTTKNKHTHTASVQVLNKILAEQLFKVQDAQELNHPEKVLSTWVKHPYGLVDQFNEMKTQMIGMSPKEVTELKEIPLINQENYHPEDMLPEDRLCHYLMQLLGEHDDQLERATDRIWSEATYRLREVVLSPGNWVMYCLSDGPEGAFVSEELMLIPEDT